MRVEIQSEFTNLVTISRAFTDSLDFNPWLTLTNTPGRASIIDEDFEERVPMPWQWW
jgi:hypothetical protein